VRIFSGERPGAGTPRCPQPGTMADRERLISRPLSRPRDAPPGTTGYSASCSSDLAAAVAMPKEQRGGGSRATGPDGVRVESRWDLTVWQGGKRSPGLGRPLLDIPGRTVRTLE
jgi:hypothetical protein